MQRRSNFEKFIMSIKKKTEHLKHLLPLFTNQKPYVYAVLYLLLIPSFAILFCFSPNVEIKYADGSSKIIQSLYFSVVTITTLGYGDITPQSPSAQFLAALESLSGVIIIGLFLNSLSYKLSLSLQEAEKTKENYERYVDEVLKLKGYYLIYVIPVTIPIQNRGNCKVNKDFLFSDMRDLFKSTLRFTDNHFEPAVKYYFHSQHELQRSVKEMICNVDVKNWPELEELCLEFLKECRDLDFGEHILSRPKTLVGDRLGSDYDVELIKNHTGEVRIIPSNSINPYIALFHLIKFNLDFIDRYKIMVCQIINRC
jgi:hypothetical protein